MLNFYHQVGYSGMFILLLGLIAIFMAIRGVVLVELIKRQAPHAGSIVQQIVVTTRSKTENLKSTVQETADVQETTYVQETTNPSVQPKSETSDLSKPETSAASKVNHSSYILDHTSSKLNHDDSGASKELIVNTLMQVQMKGVYSSMYFLKLCAAIGPLLGLLGTVLGMVDVFSTLSSRSMPDPSLLAGGIWEALLTTVMGLTLAIPALIVHYYLLMNLRYLRNRINLMLCRIKLS